MQVRNLINSGKIIEVKTSIFEMCKKYDFLYFSENDFACFPRRGNVLFHFAEEDTFPFPNMNPSVLIQISCPVYMLLRMNSTYRTIGTFEVQYDNICDDLQLIFDENVHMEA